MYTVSIFQSKNSQASNLDTKVIHLVRFKRL